MSPLKPRLLGHSLTCLCFSRGCWRKKAVGPIVSHPSILDSGDLPRGCSDTLSPHLGPAQKPEQALGPESLPPTQHPHRMRQEAARRAFSGCFI